MWNQCPRWELKVKCSHSTWPSTLILTSFYKDKTIVLGKQRVQTVFFFLRKLDNNFVIRKKKFFQKLLQAEACKRVRMYNLQSAKKLCLGRNLTGDSTCPSTRDGEFQFSHEVLLQAYIIDARTNHAANLRHRSGEHKLYGVTIGLHKIVSPER